jgi:hypothetical protein
MARFGANLPERTQFCRQRRPEEAVPRVGAKPYDAGKSSFQVAKFHCAQQRGEVSAERAQGCTIVEARIERRNQKDRGASKRRSYCLREDRQSTCRFGRAHRIGLHRVSSMVTCADFALQYATLASRVKVRPASLPSAAKPASASPRDRVTLWLAKPAS